MLFGGLYSVNTNTVDLENFVAKKVIWDKGSTHFNFVKAESIP